MQPNTAILFVFIISIWLVVFSIGAKSSSEEATFLLRRPRLLARTLIAIFVIVPGFAFIITSAFPLPPAVKFAIVALSVSPVPPFLPLKQIKIGGSGGFVVGLLVAASLGALVVTPILVEVASRILHAPAGISPGRVAETLLISTGIPLAIGLATKSAAPRVARLVQRGAGQAGVVLLMGAILLMVIFAWRSIIALTGNGAILGIGATVLVGLFAGHMLGGGHDGNRGALALAAATRHPGVAMAIADTSFPQQKTEVAAAVLLFILVNLLATAPYQSWMQGRAKRRAGTASPASVPAGE